jgi:hypothetical protein
MTSEDATEESGLRGALMAGPEEEADVMIDHVAYDLLPEYEPARDACLSLTCTA